MTQRIWEIVDSETTITKATVTADTDMHGISIIQQNPSWLTPTEVDALVSIVGTAKDWLVVNGG